ncbi:hypothetical protein M422DRAFT_42187 [Sphaerobolus stellatus SS14]|nr:hypothetical protein M422DRAFT_42187 [Sphaerobolus stellatus SS14]
MRHSHWEVPIDDVVVNGITLPQPSLPAGTGYSALIDSGTSILLGPKNTVNALFSQLSTDTADLDSNLGPKVDCTKAVNLTYIIGGKPFSVDPRDFLGPQDISDCRVQLVAATDAPSLRALMSWIIGDPFMKSNLVAFYFGNLTHPSADPPRIGFLSTVPSNAAKLYSSDISAAQSSGGIIASTQAPPTGTYTATATNSVGVGLAPIASSLKSPSSTTGNTSTAYKIGPNLLFFALVALSMSMFSS